MLFSDVGWHALSLRRAWSLFKRCTPFAKPPGVPPENRLMTDSRWWLIVVGLVTLVVGQALLPAQAGKVKVWHHDRPEHFDKAQLKQAVVSNEGAVRLSKRLEPMVG